MPNKKPIASGRPLRIVYYILAALCVFFIFAYIAVSTANDSDTEIILTMIIAVLLLTFMLHTSSTLAAIRKHLEALEEKAGK